MSAHGCLTCYVCGKPCPICGTCACPSDEDSGPDMSNGLIPWLKRRLESLEIKIRNSEQKNLSTIALSGQRTAYKQILHYALTHQNAKFRA